MRTEQTRFRDAAGWQPRPPGRLGGSAQLVLVFGSPGLLRSRNRMREIAGAYRSARVVGCSTAGEITGIEVTNDTLSVTAIELESTEIRGVTRSLRSASDSFSVGLDIGAALAKDDPRHVIVFSEGLHVNGSALASGINSSLQPSTQVTGGLAGDGERFGETLIVAEGDARPDRVTALAFYGDHLHAGYGSLGGWDPFGPERLITRSEGNVLFELDGRSALEIYRRYLGPYEDELPASALLFPLALRQVEGEPSVVRTVLSIDDQRQTMTFAGDMPEGSYARFMKANFDRLLAGARSAAIRSHEVLGGQNPDLALLISCVGRKMVLKQRVEEEVEGVRAVLGEDPVLTGFYSYGEISPFSSHSDCRLHNQTMTITTLKEDGTA